MRNNWEHIAWNSFSHNVCKGGISYGQHEVLLQLKGVPPANYKPINSCYSLRRFRSQLSGQMSLSFCAVERTGDDKLSSEDSPLCN